MRFHELVVNRQAPTSLPSSYSAEWLYKTYLGASTTIYSNHKLHCHFSFSLTLPLYKMSIWNKLNLRKPDHVEGKAWPAIAIGLFVAFGGVLFGYVVLFHLVQTQRLLLLTLRFLFRYDTGTISGILAMDYWQNLFSSGYRNSTGHLDVTPSQSSAIVSILSAGTFFGALASPALGDTIGRRLGLIGSTFFFVLGVIFQTIATSLPLFLAGRFFAGFGVGLISALSELQAIIDELPPLFYPPSRRVREHNDY